MICCQLNHSAPTSKWNPSPGPSREGSLLNFCRNRVGLVFVKWCAMTIGENLVEPLVNADVNAPPVLTLAGSFMAVPRPLSHDWSSVCRDAELEKSTARRVWGEVREQCGLAGPIMIMYLLDYGNGITNTVFVGHLGPFALAVFTLGNTFTAMAGFTAQVEFTPSPASHDHQLGYGARAQFF